MGSCSGSNHLLHNSVLCFLVSLNSCRHLENLQKLNRVAAITTPDVVAERVFRLDMVQGGLLERHPTVIMVLSTTLATKGNSSTAHSLTLHRTILQLRTNTLETHSIATKAIMDSRPALNFNHRLQHIPRVQLILRLKVHHTKCKMTVLSDSCSPTRDKFRGQGQV